MSLDWIYSAISWMLLRWHAIAEAIGVPAEAVAGTNWSWILAIVFLVVTLRALLFPVFVKQIKSQRAMQVLQPKLKELQDKHKHEPEVMQRKLMELYQTEKVNPLMGCLPMLVQIPVFLGLFHVLRRLSPDNLGTTRYGWTDEQFRSATDATLFSAPLPAKFGSSAAELTQLGAGSSITVKLIAGVLVLVMMLTTYLTSRQMILKTGWAQDPQQKMIQRLMLYGIPASLLISGVLFPIGVVIYWVTNNLFSLAQQQWVLRKFPPMPILTTSAAPATAVTPAASTSATALTAAAAVTLDQPATDPAATPAEPGAAAAAEPGVAAPAEPGAAAAAEPGVAAPAEPGTVASTEPGAAASDAAGEPAADSAAPAAASSEVAASSAAPAGSEEPGAAAPVTPAAAVPPADATAAAETPAAPAADPTSAAEPGPAPRTTKD